MSQNGANPFSFLAALDGAVPLHRQILARTRESELEIATHMVAASKASLLYAYSGNGKSSFINAGIIPFFVARGYAVFRTRPRPPLQTTDPSRAFKYCVANDFYLPDIASEDSAVFDQLKARLAAHATGVDPELVNLINVLESRVRRLSPVGEHSARLRSMLQAQADLDLHGFVRELQQRLGYSTPILFICDQFEELFVHYSNTRGMDDFVAGIGSVCRDQTLRCQFMFSMREDWVGSMIEFRKDVPDIFSSYFKLAPLRRSSVSAALTLPLAEHDIVVSPEFVEAVQTDLCQVYAEQQLSEFSPVKLTRSNPEDPYLELPALQVVLDALWRSREQAAKPFSVQHYRQLGARFQSGATDGYNCAERILSDYLDDFLNLATDARLGLQQSDSAEARLDILFLLTDRRAHRRALIEEDLVLRLARLRPAALDLPTLTKEHVQSLVEPMVSGRLMRLDTAAAGSTQYELAHDFAVREVVRRWAQLNEQRVNDIAYREKVEKEISRKRLAALFRHEFINLLLLTAGSLLLLVVNVARFVSPLVDVTPALGTKVVPLVLAAAVTVSILGVSTRIRSATLLGILTLIALPLAPSRVSYEDLLQVGLRSFINQLGDAIPTLIVFLALPTCLALAVSLLTIGLLVPSHRARAKRWLYAGAVESADIAMAVGAVAIVIVAILYTPLMQVKILPLGVWWWAAKVAAAAVVYGLFGVLLVRRVRRTPGSWLMGFKAREVSLATVPRTIASVAILFVLATVSIVTGIGGVAISAAFGLLTGGLCLTQRIAGLVFEPDETTSTLEKPSTGEAVVPGALKVVRQPETGANSHARA